MHSVENIRWDNSLVRLLDNPLFRRIGHTLSCAVIDGFANVHVVFQHVRKAGRLKFSSALAVAAFIQAAGNSDCALSAGKSAENLQNQRRFSFIWHQFPPRTLRNRLVTKRWAATIEITLFSIFQH
ncbi:MAG: hypothetical protein KAY66_00330 [Neisseria sp.]|nr:hypothetical protein [Uruburuella suis]MBP8024855.1 hypothetical protein [Neisseria sp.]